MNLKPYLEEKEKVLEALGSSMAGLSDAEAAERLAKEGPNRLKEEKKESVFRKFLGELKDPMTIVLIIAALFMIVTVLLQSSQEGGISAISGQSNSYFSKSKAKTFEAKLALGTKIAAAVFVVLSLLMLVIK